ncbi:MAG TPA: 3-oxoacyl-ACP reductase FabG [Acidimicrobiia bacterium]|nr:3-oxoacyl-ACP reductase FabG [Acidimicrobiia bacterium]
MTEENLAHDRLGGKRILITGGGRGIGAAIALRVAGEGADVAIGYLDSRDDATSVVEKVESVGRRAVAIEADVSRGADARRLVRQAGEALGSLDSLVNNAGIMPETPFLEIEEDEWRQVIDTDLTAAFHTSQAALPGMLELGSGAIVNIASRLGQIGLPRLSHYATAKAGLIGLTKSLAREFGPLGVRVNAVAPGVTITEMTSHIVDTEEGARRMADTPAGRFSQPEDVAAAVAFLLSDDAAMFHGQTLNPNGGSFMP